ncbi:hypothetical protein C0991_006944, partial [Blastosporella zonata]
MALWDDKGMLATKSICAEAVFGRRALLPEIPDMRRHYTNSGFCDLSMRADQGLMDIDDMRQILDAILQEPESLLQTHKADIASLLRVYFAVVESKTSVMNYLIEEMRQIFRKDQHFLLLSWYCLLPPAGLQMEYKAGLSATLGFSTRYQSKLTAKHLSRRLMSLTTRVKGPFSLVASILEAIIEDEGTTGGLVELTTTIKSYAAVKTFKSSVIIQWVETICPPLTKPHMPSMSKWSQIVFVSALQEILNWE